MTYNLPDHLLALKQQIGEFVAQEIIPGELELLEMPFNEAAKVLAQKRAIAKSKGLFAPHLPKTHGGLGLSLFEFAFISEILATTPFGHYVLNCQAPDIGNMELMMRYASEDIKNTFLKPLMAGEIRSCFSMTEPSFAGSNPIRMGTTAIIEGDEIVINGHKWFTTAADGASFAIVMAITAPEASAYQRASMILVPATTPGFNLKRNISIMGEAGEGYHSHAEIIYENCKVPLANLIGELGSGFKLAQERLGPGRIHHCMRWIGICERAFDMMCHRAATRALSEDKRLGHQQTIQNWIAESRVEIDASRMMVLAAAEKIDRFGAKEAKNEISGIKFYVAGVLMRVLDRALQTHGALGMTDDLLLSFWYRHERGARIYDGPDEVHKSALARSILKGYGLEVKPG
ncbi:acyl-CoA dehydrogenase family protein [Fulvivirgaceae bacterium BMA12]|uniref:Acyl-CoA dehydrogenase family protein n=1 Tax=Agaribacillus aureus TaxID=3051825 RepID=A0ABT8L725_9BACT|nr:acyl-CoA dehydrogenase family protein [Fulvivirgaceae bacterium BMA12]